MSSRARKAQRLSQHNSFDSTSKHSRNEEFSQQRETGDDSGDGTAQDFTAIEVGQFLELDPRPTFVLNLEADLDEALEPVFMNSSLHSDQQLLKSLQFSVPNASSQDQSKPTNPDFNAWIKDIVRLGGVRASTEFPLAGVVWKGFLVKQWVVISGGFSPSRAPAILPLRSDNPVNTLAEHRAQVYKENPPIKPRRALTSPHEESAAVGQPQALAPSFVTPGTPDWTLPNPEGDLSPHVIFARSVDWSVTPLGDMSTWSREFRQIACLLMANPHPAALFWGSELTVIYNKAYADGVAGNKHPGLMGTGFRGPFSEIWDFVGPIFNECRQTGKSVAVTDQMLPIVRHGFMEETFYTWSLTPLYGGTSELLGLYNAPFETTRQIRGARALNTLFKLGQETAVAKSIGEFWPQILKAIDESNEFDFPFAILYSVADDFDSEEDGTSQCSSSSQSMKYCLLEGTLGVPDDHPAAPKRLDLNRSRGGFVPSFRDAMQTREPTLLTIADGTLSESLMAGFEWRGFGEPCREAVVCPIRPTSGENTLGFLCFGINPRRQFDDDYSSFIELLHRQLATSLASVTLLETEVRRGLTAAEAAALERSRLSEELAVQRGRLQRIAEVSLVGMFSIDADGSLLEANDRWYEMTGHPRDSVYPFSWKETLHESSIPLMEKGWRRLKVDELPWSAELRLKKPCYDSVTGDEIENWVLEASQPEFWDGKLRTIVGSITDVSTLKWAENLQKRQLIEADETRRAQNNFIDITSHEMRNPLSAIVQCADGIASALSELIANENLDPRASIKESILAAETIQLCAQHQKSIVDDILTISKLDSNLLLITPVPIQPVEIVRQALQMFVVECQKVHDIRLNFQIDKSFLDLKVDMVMLDSSRLLQVLINLMTNAIKFTKSSSERTIDVSIGAYLNPPIEQGSGFEYFPTKKARSDVTKGSDWGTGEIIYLRFEVRDSGCGLKAEEKKKLFNRFSQASPRTHIQYGGSGLGLFISRQLTELQGGEIGLASQPDIGSTFAFYVKARRAESRQDFAAIQQRLSSALQSNARVAANVPNVINDDESAVSKLIPLTGMAGAINSLNPSPGSDPSEWHILIVEDNIVNQKVLAMQIRKLGCVVYIANHGGEALDLIKETKHYKGREADGKELSIVLMDLEMPVMDGLTCVRKIREMEAEGLIHGHLPIIAVTANARGEQIANAKDSGMDDVMPKPFRILQIRSKIEALLNSKAMTTE